MGSEQRWEVTLPGGKKAVVTGEIALKESGALAFNSPGRGWQTVFSPIGWIRADRLG